MAFKQKSFGGFGDSPLNQNIFKDKPGYKEASEKSRDKLKNTGKTISTAINNTASLATGGIQAYGALATAIPGMVKRGVQWVGGKREWSDEDFEKDFKTTDKLLDNANRHMDNLTLDKPYNTKDAPTKLIKRLIKKVVKKKAKKNAKKKVLNPKNPITDPNKAKRTIISDDYKMRTDYTNQFIKEAILKPK